MREFQEPMRYPLAMMMLLLFSALACNMAVGDGESESDSRPVLTDERPAILFIAPQNNTQYALGRDVLLYAEAQDSEGVARIEFYDNFDNVIETVTATTPAQQFSARALWRPPSAQTHILKARAFRSDGTQSNLQEVAVQVVEVEGLAVQPERTSQTPTPQADLSETEIITPGGGAQDINLPVRLQGVIQADSLNVRVGPGSTYGIAANSLTRGEIVEVVGRSEAGDWFVIDLGNNTFGWIFASFVEIQDGDAESLPPVAAP